MRHAAVAAVAALALAAPATAGVRVDPDLTRIGAVVACASTWQIVTGEYTQTVEGEALYGVGLAVGDGILMHERGCRALTSSVTGRSRDPLTLRRRAMAWHTLAHEYAHTRGMDHGETTPEADCVAVGALPWLMARVGVPASYAGLVRSWIHVDGCGALPKVTFGAAP